MALAKNVKSTIGVYTSNLAYPDDLEGDKRKISWSRGLQNLLKRGKTISFNDAALVVAGYRPFDKRWLYYSSDLIESPGRQQTYFPQALANVAICIVGTGTDKQFSALVANVVTDFHFHSNNKLFPLYVFESADDSGKLDLGVGDGEVIDGYRRREAITDAIHKRFRETYGPKVTKEDIFYYVYGVLHSPEYRQRFAADLKKMLPRIPLTKKAEDFKAFAKAGHDLARWHLNYETVKPYPISEHVDKLALDPEELFKVQKMTFGRPRAEQKAEGAKYDKTTIVL